MSHGDPCMNRSMPQLIQIQVLPAALVSAFKVKEMIAVHLLCRSIDLEHMLSWCNRRFEPHPAVLECPPHKVVDHFAIEFNEASISRGHIKSHEKFPVDRVGLGKMGLDDERHVVPSPDFSSAIVRMVISNPPHVSNCTMAVSGVLIRSWGRLNGVLHLLGLSSRKRFRHMVRSVVQGVQRSLIICTGIRGLNHLARTKLVRRSPQFAMFKLFLCGLEREQLFIPAYNSIIGVDQQRSSIGGFDPARIIVPMVPPIHMGNVYTSR